MINSYYVQVWIRCVHEGCEAMVDLLLSLDAVAHHNSTAMPPGWSHRRFASNGQCYSADMLCPQHGDPCVHTLEQQQACRGDAG